MGLFSFLKSAGAKLLGNKAAEHDEIKVDDAAAKADAVELNREQLLTNIVNASGVEIEDLSIDIEGDTVTVYGQTPSVADREKIVLMLGNNEGIAVVDDRISVVVEEPASVFYTVESGDTLSKIAKEQYGDANKYPVIFEANKPMLKDVDKIYPGQVLRIPPIG